MYGKLFCNPKTLTASLLRMMKCDGPDDELLERYAGLIKEYIPSQMIRRWHLSRTYWLYVRDIMKWKKEVKEPDYNFKKVTDESYGRFYENGGYLAHVCNHILFLLSYDQVMMLCDTSSSRYLSLLTLEVYEYLGFNHMPTTSTLLKVYDWGDRVLSANGNDGYRIIKCFEAICTGYIITKFDTLGSGPPYLEEIIGSFDNLGDQECLKELRDLLMEQCEVPNQMIEIFGCYRHFGHPVVNETERVND